MWRKWGKELCGYAVKDIPSKGNKKHKGPKMKAALVIILGILIAKYPFHWKLNSPYYINLKCRKTVDIMHPVVHYIL